MDNNMGNQEKEIKKEISFSELEDICSQLTSEIQKIFEGTGMYFQILSRVKTAKSLMSKLNNGRYEMNGKHIQDLIGIRIVFYYYDDIKIAKNILENVFNMEDEWSESNNDVDKFKAIKRNGVFKIPEECMKIYTHESWKLPIDKTFEIQLRTMFFEGWHEIEHDMRYKKSKVIGDLWYDNYSLSRIMNCVLANLELCDWSLVNLFDQLADSHMSAGKWELMIKSKFRIRMKDEKLEPELESVFNAKPEIVTRFFACTRNQLIQELLKHEKPVITPSYIIRMLNERIVKDEEIFQACEKIQWKKAERLQMKYDFKRLKRYPTFMFDAMLGHNESRSIQDEATDVAFIVYRWAYERFKNVFDMPENVQDFQSEAPGYKLAVKYQYEKMKFSMHAVHIDMERPGTLWNVHAEYSETDGKLHFTTQCSVDSTSMISYPDMMKRPHFIKEMFLRFGFEDVEKLGSDINWIKTADDYEKFKSLVEHKNRKFPVILVCQYGNQKRETLIKVTSLAKNVCEYAHIYALEGNMFDECSDMVGREKETLNGSVIIFWKNSVEYFGEEQIKQSQFDFNRFVFSDGQIYDKAFRRKVLQMVKEHNRNDN